MKNKPLSAFTITITIILITFTFPLNTLNAAEFKIQVNETLLLPVPPEHKIRLTGRAVIDAQDEGDNLKIRGLQPGQATVTIGDATHTIQVSATPKVATLKPSKNHFITAVQELLKNRRGLTIDQTGSINGHLHRLRDWQEIVEIAEAQTASYTFQALLDNDIQFEAQQWILKKITAAGLPLPQIYWRPYTQLTVAVEAQPLDFRFQKILKPLGISIQFQKSELTIEPLVRVNIVVAEINKKVQTQLGIQWPQQAEAQILPRFSGPTNLAVFLKGLEQKGLGQILASPNLLARSGSEAEFLAGGEFPIKIITPQRREVIWKRHGLFLKIKPRADRSGHMSIELSTEISLVDHSQEVEGIPGIKTNRTATHFDLSGSQTIILSGLIRQDWGESTDGIIGLSRLPILGSLFRSENFQSQKTELIIFVTPEIVKEALHE